MAKSAPARARDRVRAELTKEIKDTAREQLREVGASSLSMRAVAQELGMASSAIYRYFSSREELITALILDAYNSIGEACEQADATLERLDSRSRWTAVTKAIREWAIANPHEYSLIYGTPIPGYKAPAETILAAGRATTLLFAILNDANRENTTDDRIHFDVPTELGVEITQLRLAHAPGVPEPLLVLGLMAFSQIFGTISLELYGHFDNVIENGSAYYDLTMEIVADRLGL